MARIVLLLLILIAGWLLIFLPLVSGSQALNLPWGERLAADLPRPWKSGATVQLLPRSSSVVDSAAECPAEYALQSGETLGEIARRCAIPLESLLAANPQIANPNRVYAGQAISIPFLEGRGSGDDVSAALSSADLPGRYSPGSVVEVQAAGLPPGAKVRVGLGLSSTGYRVLGQAVSGADGRLSITITLPESAQPGDTAFLLVTAAGIPSVQVISPEFTIEE
jgi:LysM repeat protein